ncbi:MAG: hypothetical protein ACLFVP_01085 [Candidatus Bathyarchaeia archaeon]
MIHRDYALDLVKETSKYPHALVVGRIMDKLTIELDKDVEEWELVGLLHYLDLYLVHEDLSEHGPRAAEILKGKLSEGGLQAISAHDFRSGYTPSSDLDISLVFADSLAVLLEEHPVPPDLEFDEFRKVLDRFAEEKKWIRDNIVNYRYLDEIDLLSLVEEALRATG